MASEAGELFDEKAAARILNVAPRTLRRWREDGRVVFYKTATDRIRYRIEDLIEAGKSTRAGR